ncbi:type II secretion system F family protein [Candidatus Fermentibacteria bacterium]|nr:type II secretion system F family protein [Candidatus Fermentibacteria bacterium]
MNPDAQADYCADLALLLQHGTPMAEACDLLAGEAGVGSIEMQIASGVKSGESLRHALEATRVPSWALAAVEATETTGRPADGLDLASRVLREHRVWRDRMIRVTTYPLLVLGSSLLLGLILFRSILPTISVLAEELGADLPLATRTALVLGHAAMSPVAWVIALVALGGTLALASDQGRLRAAASRLPVMAEVIRMDESRRYFGVLGALLAASVPLDRAMERTAHLVVNASWHAEVLELARRVRAGDSPAAAARDVRWFPTRVARVLAVAETAGTLHQACSSLADYAERVLTRRLDGLARWVPLILLAAAAAFIAFLAQALLMPAFQIDIAL